MKHNFHIKMEPNFQGNKAHFGKYILYSSEMKIA